MGVSAAFLTVILYVADLPSTTAEMVYVPTSSGLKVAVLPVPSSIGFSSPFLTVQTAFSRMDSSMPEFDLSAKDTVSVALSNWLALPPVFEIIIHLNSLKI